MTNVRQSRNLICGLSLGAATAALAIVFLLTVVATQPAQAQTFSVLHNFTGGQDGANPYAGVTLDKAGNNLYGTASAGGTGDGTVYKLTHKGSGWIFNPLYSFTGSFYGDGANPLARVIFGPNGTLYGTTYHGGTSEVGTVFNLRPSPTACKTALCPWTETVLYSFTGGADGGNPGLGDLIFDQAGNIFGTTFLGGIGAGVVYELTPKSGGGYTEDPIYTFSGSDGANPYNGVIFDNAGNLYGTTYQGGLGGVGTVFELMYPGWTQQCTLNNFTRSTGAYLYAGLIFDQSGNLYGATSDYGKNGGGTVFELTSLGNCSWTLKTLYSFTGTAGGQCGPRGTLVMDGAGNLYGTTTCDGANQAGNVFELTYPNWTYEDLYDFTGGNDGGNPNSNVVIDANGNLYGTTYAGGTQNVGVVWEITP